MLAALGHPGNPGSPIRPSNHPTQWPTISVFNLLPSLHSRFRFRFLFRFLFRFHFMFLCFFNCLLLHSNGVNWVLVARTHFKLITEAGRGRGRRLCKFVLHGTRLFAGCLSKYLEHVSLPATRVSWPKPPISHPTEQPPTTPGN